MSQLKDKLRKARKAEAQAAKPKPKPTRRKAQPRRSIWPELFRTVMTCGAVAGAIVIATPEPQNPIIIEIETIRPAAEETTAEETTAEERLLDESVDMLAAVVPPPFDLVALPVWVAKMWDDIEEVIGEVGLTTGPSFLDRCDDVRERHKYRC